MHTTPQVLRIGRPLRIVAGRLEYMTLTICLAWFECIALTTTYVGPTILQTPSIRCQQERAGHRRGGYRQSECREHGPFDEERAYRRAGKHRDDGTKSSLPAGIATPRQGRVRRKTRNGQRQHGSGEISNTELSDGCISHAHGQRSAENNRIQGSGGILIHGTYS